jgi:glycosyltransferase involved in cell wall biosynthesis
MACGIPNIVPEYSALGEWPRGGVHYTQISRIPDYTTKGLNTRGGIPDIDSTIQALELLYNNEQYRKELGQKGYLIATQAQFDWKNIAAQFETVFRAEAMEIDDG